MSKEQQKAARQRAVKLLDAGWVQALQTQLQVPLRLLAEVNGDLDAYEIRSG